MNNPFEDKAPTAAKSGTYKAVLEEIKPVEKAGFEPASPPRKTLVFHFRTAGGDRVSKIVNANNNEKGACVALARSLSSELSSDIIRDSSKLWTFLQGCIGRPYLVQTEPSSCGRYNNLRSVVPLPESEQAA